MSSDKNSIVSISALISGDGGEVPRQGMSVVLTSIFLMAQMAGAGFLALPKGLADVGWLGIPMMLLFCVLVGFAGTRLGKSWVMLEERWPQYRQPSRQPYMDIAEKSLGKTGRQITLVSLIINLFGSTTVFIILISEMVASILMHSTPEGQCGLTKCQLVIVVGLCVVPFTWLGTPKDFWQASLLAVAATSTAVVVIVVQILTDTESLPDEPHYPNPTVSSFSLGFGSILFAFGGAAVFPTIQNDMADRSKFWKSISCGFTGILSLYLPVALSGYIMYGDQVKSNILLTVNLTVAVEVAIALQIINLLCTFVISSNPVFQSVEDLLHVPNKFGFGRILVRTMLVFLQVLIGLAVPDFALILNLIGGSVISLCTFVLPPLMYMNLVDDKSGPWPQRTIPLWERALLVEIIIVGVIGGICSTVSSFYAIIVASFHKSCFLTFNECEE
ncbi:amino acid transporter AVT1D-like isoform X4 [Homarus americanus]|uniref:amino acid transporter AVT1D-like isoform X4 n=1 Tax=Homarus americanus TaxID=6706 RepID=UPI001C457261|nr:amino acid transporter AVT1D-like isoform X4 [Homarus americanus]